MYKVTGEIVAGQSGGIDIMTYYMLIMTGIRRPYFRFGNRIADPGGGVIYGVRLRFLGLPAEGNYVITLTRYTLEP